VHFYDIMNFLYQARASAVVPSPSFIELYWPSPSEMLFGVFRALFSAFLLPFFTKEERKEITLMQEQKYKFFHY